MSSVGAGPVLLLLILLGVALLSLLLGLRDPVIAKVGLRSFVCGRRRTLLWVLGLVVGTLIISSSLVVGDTVGTLATHATYISDGAVHEAIFDRLEVFVALGLMVGIAAIGITSLRAVVERRSQIGIARALGLRRRQVLFAFLREYGSLAAIGILIGTAMGLLIAYPAAEGAGAGFLTFSVP